MMCAPSVSPGLVWSVLLTRRSSRACAYWLLAVSKRGFPAGTHPAAPVVLRRGRLSVHVSLRPCPTDQTGDSGSYHMDSCLFLAGRLAQLLALRSGIGSPPVRRPTSPALMPAAYLTGASPLQSRRAGAVDEGWAHRTPPQAGPGTVSGTYRSREISIVTRYESSNLYGAVKQRMGLISKYDTIFN